VYQGSISLPRCGHLPSSPFSILLPASNRLLVPPKIIIKMGISIHGFFFADRLSFFPADGLFSRKVLYTFTNSFRAGSCSLLDRYTTSSTGFCRGSPSPRRRLSRSSSLWFSSLRDRASVERVSFRVTQGDNPLFCASSYPSSPSSSLRCCFCFLSCPCFPSRLPRDLRLLR